jgi:hypothetical protein
MDNSLGREDEFNQAMLERLQQLEEALQRAEARCASKDDFKIIRFECGVPTKVNLNRSESCH